MGYLTAEERGYIETAVRFDVPLSRIAKQLGRHRSTIYRELKRNTMSQGEKSTLAAMSYQATSAGNLARMRKKNAGQKTKATKPLIKRIRHYLTLKLSPEQIACGIENIGVCTTTIYNWIYTGVLDFNKKQLRRKGKRFKARKSGKLLRRPDSKWLSDRSIELRPTEITTREAFGHWEADSVLSSRQSSAALATFVERKTRQYQTYRIPQKTAKNMYEAMRKLMKDYPNAVHSITCDRGTEFMSQKYVSLMEKLGVTIYFAHPFSPHERGSNEYHNGLLREYFPKGSTFTKITQRACNQATKAINNRPRKLFNWKSAQEVFQNEIVLASIE